MPCSINFSMTLEIFLFKHKLQVFSNKSFFSSHLIPCFDYLGLLSLPSVAAIVAAQYVVSLFQKI